MSKSEAEVIAKLNKLCGDAIEFDTKAGRAAAAAATTDSSSYACKSAIEAREYAGAAYGCYLEAMHLFHDLPDTLDVISTVNAIVDDIVRTTSETENEESAKSIVENIEWYSDNAICSAKKADNACIRLKRVYWHPSTGV